MRIRHKKLLVSGAAVTVAGVLGIGTLIQTSLSVQASAEMMPGIETVINENSGEKPFKILELTDSSDKAEIGYYVSGQEPYIKLYTWQYTDSNNETKVIHFHTLEEGLKMLPEGKRREFAMNVRLDADGNIDTNTSTGIRSVADISTGDAQSSPLSVTDYQEKYFLGSGDDESAWKRIDFTDTDGNPRTDTVRTEGTYQENSEGTGDYTKETQTYYPIRNDKSDDGQDAETFRENAENFYFSEGDGETSRGAYFLEFASVSNDKVNKAIDADGGKFDILPEYDYENGRYGYYENVYEDLTSEIVNNIISGKFTFPGENPTADLTNAKLLIEQPDDAVKRDPDEENDFSAGADSTDVSSTETEVSSDVSGSGDDFSGGESPISFDNGFNGGESDGDEDLTAEDGSFSDENSGDTVVSTDTAPDTAGDSSASDGFSDSESDFSGDPGNGDFQEEPDAADISGQVGDSVEAANATDSATQSGILGEMADEKTAGSQSNPYVYLSESIDEYPYFKYTLIGDLEYVRKIAVDITDPDHQDETRADGDITLESDQYWYWKADDNGILTKYPVTVVTGRQPVAYKDLKKIPSDISYNYYFRVSKVYFCCTSSGDGSTSSDYQFQGWYFASYPEGAEAYLPETDRDKATHYISDAEYSLTPGTGNYDFVPGGDTKHIVQVNHMFFQGGYTNNDWFKKYVFHLTPKASADAEDGQFENFNIQVDTRNSNNPQQEIYVIPADSEDTPPVGAADDTSAGAEEGSETEDFSSEDESQAEVSEEETDAAGVDLSDAAEVSTEEEDTEAVGDSAEELKTLIEGYDLIYINGKLSDAAAAAISQSSVPCIINQANVSTTELGTMGSFAKTDDDGHYVNTYVYFFRNTLAEGTQDPSFLVNTQFHTNFNGNADSDSYEPSDEAKGFEEILSYIESENKYRALGSRDDSDVGDGEERKLDPLDKQISQARAIEYIINYKYRRYLKTKSSVRVLEIEPSGSDSQISSGEIDAWLDDGKSEGSLVEKAEVCCYNKEGIPSNMLDGKSSTYWHSAYGNANSSDNVFDSSITDKQSHINSLSENKHWMTFTLRTATDVSGFFYQPKPGYPVGGYQNGVVDKYTVELYDENDNLLKSVSGNTNLSSNYSKNKKSYSLGETVQGVKKIKFIFGTTNANAASEKNKFASCAQFGISYRDVTVDTMTAAEFVGHRDDIASKYDLVYVGDYSGGRNNFLNGSGNTMLYAHVGAAVSSEVGLSFAAGDGRFNIGKLLGQLDNEWDNTYVPSGQYLKRMAPVSTYSESGAGYFRGSGNDMTSQECEKLKDFLKSGYPVVIGDSLVTGSGSDRKINTDKVDAASYYYEFLTEALKYDNTATKTDAINGNLSSFFINLAKPVIQFTEGGRPPEPARANDTSSVSDENTGNIDKELKYTFTVQNDSDAAPASSTYDCDLYIDLNFDGVFSSKEIQDKYMTIEDASGTVLSQVSYGKNDQRYQLKIGQTYTVTRKIPSDYYKLITWKLVLTSNENTYIHTSETGYAKQNNPDHVKQTINVLQIIPDKGGNWRLAQDTDLKNRLARDVEDFNINIEEITVTNFANLADVKAKLDTKQMLIIGFDDAYQNIPNDRGQVDAILAFVKSGRSIIFSHDTTSFQNYQYSTVYPRVAKQSYPEGNNYYDLPRDNWLQSRNPDWGLSIGSILREVVGMDRYGITSTDAISDNMTVSQLLKQGKELNSSEVSFSKLMQLAGDVAYKTGDATRSTSYAQTQGYTYKILQLQNFNGAAETRTALKVNDGAITQYPYRVGARNGNDGESITVSTTHVQYYQLALEQDYDINGRSDGETDMVVWYCLGGNGYQDSVKDARNNYYYYSKGNVIYTGSGHATVGNNEDEVELFINSIVAAANVTAVQPEISFVKALNPAAETESVRYYMTDQSKWTQEEANTLEKDMDFYVNVKDYNMVSADLSDEDLSKQKMTVEFYIDDDNGTPVQTDSGVQKLTNVTGAVGTLTEYGTGATVSLSGNQFVLNQNNAYGFTMPDIEQYLRSSGNGYKKDCRLYVKVSSTVYLYGSPVESTTWSSIDLKQRQLFELD